MSIYPLAWEMSLFFKFKYFWIDSSNTKMIYAMWSVSAQRCVFISA